MYLVKFLAGVDEPADEEERCVLDACASGGSAAPAADPDAAAASLARTLFACARRAVQASAQDRETDIGDLATTLIIALATTRSVVVAQVGDGVVAIRLRSGDLVGPLTPQRGEFANETTFITTGDELPEVSLACFAASDVDAFGLSSDGMRLLITSNPLDGTPHAPFFDDVFSSVASGVGSTALTRFLEQADDRTGDDKSLVIGVRVG
jgi:hypothetical protein